MDSPTTQERVDQIVSTTNEEVERMLSNSQLVNPRLGNPSNLSGAPSERRIRLDSPPSCNPVMLPSALPPSHPPAYSEYLPGGSPSVGLAPLSSVVPEDHGGIRSFDGQFMEPTSFDCDSPALGGRVSTSSHPYSPTMPGQSELHHTTRPKGFLRARFPAGADFMDRFSSKKRSAAPKTSMLKPTKVTKADARGHHNLDMLEAAELTNSSASQHRSLSLDQLQAHPFHYHAFPPGANLPGVLHDNSSSLSSMSSLFHRSDDSRSLEESLASHHCSASPAPSKLRYQIGQAPPPSTLPTETEMVDYRVAIIDHAEEHKAKPALAARRVSYPISPAHTNSHRLLYRGLTTSCEECIYLRSLTFIYTGKDVDSTPAFVINHTAGHIAGTNRTPRSNCSECAWLMAMTYLFPGIQKPGGAVGSGLGRPSLDLPTSSRSVKAFGKHAAGMLSSPNLQRHY
ncbi:hypothetical protein FA13DRAFT_1793490 [Coprinellus micaceus]|uniref:Uncharacterized protein n=1 Tax=Coprinellus micaceus TaxID=71717 RepID=A0A4Y7T4F5_COPMI|nr:hypothetical protein FA13DRAFT_1793490 [Coprinellus micaceus]